MTQPGYPPANAQIAERRKQLAPGIHDAFEEFSRQVFAAGALDDKTKQLIAVAVAHVTQCPYCIQGHTRAALRKGASEQELMEAIWVAAEMRAGGAYAHSAIALDTAAEIHSRRRSARRDSVGACRVLRAPRSAPYIRNQDGGGRRAAANVAGVDGPPRPCNNAVLRRPRAEHARGGDGRRCRAKDELASPRGAGSSPAAPMATT
jgi:AhpD family alkylhydroperoxidase